MDALASTEDPEWIISEGRIPYQAALAAMEAHVGAIRAATGRERVWLVEHDPTYTAGTSARPEDLHDARFHPDDCSLCAFTLAKAEVPWAPVFYILPIYFPEVRLHTPGRVFGTDQPTDLSRRRGPPALFMPYPV